MLDPRSDRALYRQLADVLREKILHGELRPGQRLPSEPTLSQEYGLSRTAIRNALGVLRAERLVVTERGYGTRVRMAAERRRVTLGPEEQAVVRMPTEAERHDLHLDEGVSVIEVRRGVSVEVLPADEIILVGHGR